MKATEQHFPVVLFIMLHKMTFESVSEILKLNHSNEGLWSSTLFGAIFDLFQLFSKKWELSIESS